MVDGVSMIGNPVHRVCQRVFVFQSCNERNMCKVGTWKWRKNWWSRLGISKPTEHFLSLLDRRPLSGWRCVFCFVLSNAMLQLLSKTWETHGNTATMKHHEARWNAHPFGNSLRLTVKLSIWQIYIHARDQQTLQYEHSHLDRRWILSYKIPASASSQDVIQVCAVVRCSDSVKFPLESAYHTWDPCLLIHCSNKIKAPGTPGKLHPRHQEIFVHFQCPHQGWCA